MNNFVGMEKLFNERLARIAMLLCSNSGSFEINGKVGQVVACATNRYGRTGLTIEEAFELTYYRGMYDALSWSCTAQEMESYGERIKREMEGGVIVVPSATDVKRLLASGPF